MSKLAIIFWSSTGNTEAMANAVLEGAKSVNADSRLFNVANISADDAAEYDTLLLGCPAMGTEELEESEFEPFFAELEGKLAGKNVGLFGSYGWGDGEWMRAWIERTAAAGAKLVTDEGVMANEEPDDEALEVCRELGKAAAV